VSPWFARPRPRPRSAAKGYRTTIFQAGNEAPVGPVGTPGCPWTQGPGTGTQLKKRPLGWAYGALL
jgi:hypothetical protein